MRHIEQTDVAIIGGGYYGAFVADEIKRHRPNFDVTIIEREDSLFRQASSTNQGQFHMGYMYSADSALAAECVEHTERFSDTFSDAIDRNTTSLYGIHKNSEISADDYTAFCEQLDLPLQSIARPEKIFGGAILASFRSAETTFNSAIVQKIFMQRLALGGVKRALGFSVDRVAETPTGLQIIGNDRIIQADNVFNVTFADINNINERSGLPKVPLRYDTFLHFVLDLPQEYESTAATVIRGPYASLLPSKFRNGHVLASGKYRRIQSTTTDKPLEDISEEQVQFLYNEAVEDAAEYMPLLRTARRRGHTVGTRAAHFDPSTGAYSSKALVFKDYAEISNYHTVLGGKVSCMFDITGPIREIFS